MIKKTLILAIMLIAGLAGGMAQTMTDQQVADYITNEYNNGKSQQSIIISLTERGVSRAQLLRVRSKYLSQKNALRGADGSAQLQDDRTRKKPVDPKVQEKTTTDQYNQKFQSETNNYEPVNDISLRPLGDRDSLAIYYDMMRTSKIIFGHDLFSKENLTFEPNLNMATPAKYTLGAGDEVTIDVFGASQKTFTSTISPDGVIVIENIGPIRLAGLSVASAKNTIANRLGKYYADCHFDLSVGNIRTIQVQVVGEVEMPGTYSLSGLATSFNALYAAGGIKEIGTLRNIKVYRNSRVIANIDVYDYLINGNTSGDIRLQDGDMIVVGAYETLVNIDGQVKRPMYYELKKTETLKQLIAFTGGFAGGAYTNNIKVIRKDNNEYSIHTVGEFDMGSFLMKDGDEVYVDSIEARYTNMVEVRGAINHAGQYQFGASIRTVKELITAANGLREDAYMERAIIRRLKDDLSRENVGIDIKGIIEGTSADIQLKKNDILFIPSKTEMRGEWTFDIKGEVIYPGKYPYADNTTIQDMILQAGGLTNAASLAHVNVYRRITDSKATEDNQQLAEHYSFSLNENYEIVSDTTFFLKPFDEVYIRKSPSYEEQQNVTIAGCVNFIGQYTMTKKDYRLSDLIRDAGGFTSLAYVPGARLSRRLTDTEKIQRDNALRQAQIQLYESSLTSENKMDFEKADTLLNMKMNLDDTYPVAVDLDKAMEEPGGLYDIVLRKGDIVTIPQFTNTVKVSGEVSYPISMNFKKGESLKYYINHAGGFANRAKKRAIYIVYANGSVEKVTNNTSKAVQPGCEIVVPTKDESKKLSTAEMMSLSSGSMSIATMIVSMINLMK